jgi:hypothetical protein
MMAWQGIIASAEGALGSRDEIAAQLTSMFPGLSFEWSRGGMEKLADIDARGIELPDLVRRAIAAAPSAFCAETEIDAVSVSFSLGSSESVIRIWGTLEGDSRTVSSFLDRLRAQPGWTLMSEPLEVRPVGPDDEIQLTGDATLLYEADPDPALPTRKRAR